MALTAVDRDLVQRCLKNEPGAWEDFVDRFLGLIYHVVHHTAYLRSSPLRPEDTEDVAAEIRHALKYIPPERLIVSSDCGFGRQGCNREIAFYKASAIAQGCNIVRRELGLATTYVAAADPMLQIDIVKS